MDISSTPADILIKQMAQAPSAQRPNSTRYLAPMQSNEQRAEKAAHDFESFFLYQMLELTDPGTVEGFDGGSGEEMFRQIRNEHIADEMTKAGGIGIADSIYDQLLKIQELNQ